MGLPGLTELKLTVLLGQASFLLLMGLPVRTLTCLNGGTLLSLMGLPGRIELVPATLKMNLLKQTELRTGTIQNNKG